MTIDIEIFEIIRQQLLHLDQQYTQEAIPLDERPLKALANIVRANEKCAILNVTSPIFKTILDWYIQKYTHNNFMMYTMAKTPYLEGNEIWPFTIHTLAGSPSPAPINDIIHEKLPNSVLKSIENNFERYVYIWADANDFMYGYKSMVGKSPSEQEHSMLNSGVASLQSAALSLLEIPPNNTMEQTARMAIEMSLKAYFIEQNSLNEQELKTKYGHNITKLLDSYLALNPTSELTRIKHLLEKFPSVNERYAQSQLSIHELWKLYQIALFIVAAIFRALTDVKCRPVVEQSFPNYKIREFK
jgi:hypothetical protein